MCSKSVLVAITALVCQRIALASHHGGAPVDPRTPTDERFVVDVGGSLDTGCTFRSGGPLIITLDIDRYVGPVDANGYLIDPGSLVGRQIVSPIARLRMPAFDVDSDAIVPPPAPVPMMTTS
jgi:hypothetical protein